MKRNKLYQFADNRVFIDIGMGCGNACRYCYLDDAAEQQSIFEDNEIHECIDEPLKKVCKKSANCDKIEIITQEADFLWQEGKENR